MGRFEKGLDQYDVPQHANGSRRCPKYDSSVGKRARSEEISSHRVHTVRQGIPGTVSTSREPDDLLMKADKMSMAASLEARVSFLDHKLVEFVAATIPSGLRLRRLTTKYMLKHSVQGLLPHEIIRRRKQGFDVPLVQWVRENKEFVQGLLLSSTALSCVESNKVVP